MAQESIKGERSEGLEGITLAQGRLRTDAKQAAGWLDPPGEKTARNAIR